MLGATSVRAALLARINGTSTLRRWFSSVHVPGITPHGGKLQDLVLKGEELVELKQRAINLPSLTLSHRQLCDVELILNGGFSPLAGFMNHHTYNTVVESSHLPNGLLFPMPITLDVHKKKLDNLLQANKSNEIALRDEEGNLIAVLKIDDIYSPDRDKEARMVFSSTDDHHPGVAYLKHHSGDLYIGGELLGAQLPIHYDYNEIRKTPLQLREQFERLGWKKIIAFQTRNPMHRAHLELTLRAAETEGAEAKVLLHPVVGMTKPGDIDYHTRIKCYKAIMGAYPKDSAMLSLLPLAMRMGGPREAIWHAIIRKNYGSTHFIVGRDHAGPGADKAGKDYYGPYDAQHATVALENELGLRVMPFQMMVYVASHNKYYPVDSVPAGEKTSNISGTKLRELLRTGGEIPAWFTYPEVVSILRRAHPPRHQQGFTIFFTGLSGSGKSTIANALHARLLEEGSRSAITLLDGDVVRHHLSSELTFSKEHRNLNVTRIAYVASEITKCRGIALCAPIAPYEESRKAARTMISHHGGFIEVFVATSLGVCEQRDRKGLYAKARAGLVKNFTGLDDPYEEPQNPELRIDTSIIEVRDAVEMIIAHLQREGYLQK